MNRPSSAVTNYEVYVFDGRNWTLHARFQRSERDEALLEAKKVERAEFLGCKVVREDYYPGRNSSEETVVYVSDRALLKAGRTAQRAGAQPAARARSGAAPNLASQPGQEAPAYAVAVLARLSLIIAAALTGAFAVTGIINAFLFKIAPYIRLDQDNQVLILFSSFLVAFLVIAVPLTVRYLQRQSAAKTGKRRPVTPPPPPARRRTAPAAATPAQRPPQEPPPETNAGAAESIPVEDAPRDPVTEAAQAMIEPIPGLPTAENAPEPPAAPKTDAKAAETAPPEPPPAQTPADIPAEGDAHKTRMMNFLSALLAEIRTTRPNLDSYNRFGVDLMLAGAIEVLGDHFPILTPDKHRILENIIEVMGVPQDVARKFADKYNDYLIEPRYMTMVQAGRSAMEGFLAGNMTGIARAAGALDSWNKPRTPQTPSRIRTLLFTDMVGSTSLTQSRGDRAAQDVLRLHNRIVRSALAEFEGREIKHTGDGIMAAFASTAKGVEAAIAIQRAIAAAIAEHPALPLHVRIGMDAGEPIEEGDDLFGTTVQLASRVCAQAEADHILCTNVVRELAAGKKFDFTALGDFELKGFKDKIALFDIQWEAKDDAVPARDGTARKDAARR